jgi:ABC-2 type transport system ATP-binding protein
MLRADPIHATPHYQGSGALVSQTAVSRSLEPRARRETAVIVQGLTKSYSRVKAVDDIAFKIEQGEIFAFLGPNGAGKTTTMRMMLGLVRPTHGRISVFGVDAVAQAGKVRRMVGYVPQEVSVYSELTGYENLLLYAKLYGVPREHRERRIHELLGYLELQDRVNDLVQTYSGGMMRRLELGQALVNRPRLLLLDEPSVGLDPTAKRAIWDLIERMRTELGSTVFFTSHDMTEADTFSDTVAIMNRGRLVVTGDPKELKSSVAREVLTVYSDAPSCSARLEELGYKVVANSSDGRFELFVSEGEREIPLILDGLRAGGVEVEAVSLNKPTLEDVFLKYAGTRLEDQATWTETRRRRRTFRRRVR